MLELLPMMLGFLQQYFIQQTSQQNGMLIIRNAQSGNTGEYFCTATNNLGRSVARIVINVIDRQTPFPGGEVQVSIIILSYQTLITPSYAYLYMAFFHFPLIYTTMLLIEYGTYLTSRILYISELLGE